MPLGCPTKGLKQWRKPMSKLHTPLNLETSFFVWYWDLLVASPSYRPVFGRLFAWQDVLGVICSPCRDLIPSVFPFMVIRKVLGDLFIPKLWIISGLSRLRCPRVTSAIFKTSIVDQVLLRPHNKSEGVSCGAQKLSWSCQLLKGRFIAVEGRSCSH